jgi:hypothetical protein
MGNWCFEPTDNRQWAMGRTQFANIVLRNYYRIISLFSKPVLFIKIHIQMA